MPSVASQILFFFAAGAVVLGILFFVSRGEKGTGSPNASPQRAQPSSKPAPAPYFKAAAGRLLFFPKKSFQTIQGAIHQPHEVFVHTREMVGRFRGEKHRSVLDKTFEQDPERNFSLQDVAADINSKAEKAAAAEKQTPKLVQKLRDQFEERNAGDGKKAASDGEEEFWLGILRQNPHTAHPYKKLGEIYLKRGDYKEAQASLAFALKKSPEDKEAAALLAEVKEKRGGGRA